jgi:hypothetical protein
MHGPANQSLSPIEPVSGAPKRKLENNEQRLVLEKRSSRTRCSRIGAQRLRHASLSRRNVGGTHTPGNRAVETRLAGWRSSEDGPLLCPFSLLTGNFAGNFIKSRHLARQRLKIRMSERNFRRKFPTQQNREIILPEQGIQAQEQGISSPGPRISHA